MCSHKQTSCKSKIIYTFMSDICECGNEPKINYEINKNYVNK